MGYAFFATLSLQGIVLALDEVLFHYHRPLPKWERWGHPLDTLTVLAAFLALYLWPQNLFLYLGLSIFSCLFITKDEWVHKTYCTANEQWLHSILFVIHPVVFYLGYRSVQDQDTGFLIYPIILLVIFMVYQIIYWNFYANKKLDSRLAVD